MYRYTREAGRAMLVGAVGRIGVATYRKTARIIATEIPHQFEVETDQGVIRGDAGDFLATNHPDDDPGSDVWPISAERMAATYRRVE